MSATATDPRDAITVAAFHQQSLLDTLPRRVFVLESRHLHSNQGRAWA
ncbi:hypothetical protein [Nocardia sp. NPDC004711]